MTDELVIYEKLGPVARLTLNRPAALNAVNLAMRDELWVLLQAVRDDPDVRAVLIRGAGERAFCAGADVKEFGSAPSLVEARRARRERDLWGMMLDLPKPLVAAIHGWALGAGCELSLLCDVRIAAEDARFGLPEVALGYIPSAGGTQTLPRTIPCSAAVQMILTGAPINAPTALRLGLIHAVVPRGALDAAAQRAAESLARLSPEFVAAAKAALRDGQDLPLPIAVRRESERAAMVLGGRGTAPSP
jgi:enoyl-CoA hydratase/carnithine racemase